MGRKTSAVPPKLQGRRSKYPSRNTIEKIYRNSASSAAFLTIEAGHTRTLRPILPKWKAFITYLLAPTANSLKSHRTHILRSQYGIIIYQKRKKCNSFCENIYKNNAESPSLAVILLKKLLCKGKFY